MFRKINAFDGLFYSSIAFLVLTGIAMLVYPGGKYFDHNSIGYSFFENFYSDLGRFKTFSGGSKIASTIFFIAGVLQISFFLSLFIRTFVNKILPKDKCIKTKFIAKYSIYCYSILLTLTALTPYDKKMLFHALFANFSFLMMMIASATISYLIYKNNKIPKNIAILFLLYSVLLLVYIYMLFTIPLLLPNADPYYHPTAQKIVVFSMIFLFIYISRSAKKYLT